MATWERFTPSPSPGEEDRESREDREHTVRVDIQLVQVSTFQSHHTTTARDGQPSQQVFMEVLAPMRDLCHRHVEKYRVVGHGEEEGMIDSILRDQYPDGDDRKFFTEDSPRLNVWVPRFDEDREVWEYDKLRLLRVNADTAFTSYCELGLEDEDTGFIEYHIEVLNYWALIVY
jgi:hypothetical protein